MNFINTMDDLSEIPIENAKRNARESKAEKIVFKGIFLHYIHSIPFVSLRHSMHIICCSYHYNHS